MNYTKTEHKDAKKNRNAKAQRSKGAEQRRNAKAQRGSE
jgi:hypothetical protein